MNFVLDELRPLGIRRIDDIQWKDETLKLNMGIIETSKKKYERCKLRVDHAIIEMLFKVNLKSFTATSTQFDPSGNRNLFFTSLTYNVSCVEKSKRQLTLWEFLPQDEFDGKTLLEQLVSDTDNMDETIAMLMFSQNKEITIRVRRFGID
jgi:hypothetical protein